MTEQFKDISECHCCSQTSTLAISFHWALPPFYIPYHPLSHCAHLSIYIYVYISTYYPPVCLHAIYIYNKKTVRTSNDDCLYLLNIFYSFLMFSVGREKVHWERMV